MPTETWELIVLRDRFTCVRCGERGTDVAHILPKGRYPELRDAPENMLVLCRTCHEETHTYEGRGELLRLMQEKHGLVYDDPQYAGYLE